MAEKKFTPGPWKVEVFEKSEMGLLDYDKVCVWSGRGMVAEINGNWGRLTVEKQIAIARLIAASPALYEALRQAEIVISKDIPIEQPVHVPGISGIIRAALELATEGRDV